MEKRYGKMKTWLVWLLVVAMIVMTAGCAASGDEPAGDSKKGDKGGGMSDGVSAKGRYIETQIDTPKGFNGRGTIRRLADGKLALLDTENGTKSVSSDEGKTWKTEKIKELQSLLNGGDAEITSEALSADGGVFFSYILWDKAEKGRLYSEKYVYRKPNGETTEFELGIEDYHACLSKAVFTADGRLFAGTNSSHIYEINYQKKSCKKIISPESAMDMVLCSNEDSLIATDGQSVYFYNLKSKELKADDTVLNDYVQKLTEKKDDGIALCCAKNGKDNQTLYLAGTEGITGHAIGGSVMEQLVDGALTNLGDPSKSPQEMLQNEDGSFLILYGDGELDSYVYDAEAPSVPERQITIYGLHDNETIRQAISVFRKKDSEIFVKFEVGVSGEDGMTESDAIKNLNTQLLAGEGPDLILLDGMPFQSYEEKGMLADLTDVVAELESSGSFFNGILKGYQRKNNIYALPFRYRVPMLVGNRDILSRISDLKTLADEAEKLADQPTTKETVMGSYSAEELLEKLYFTSANAWITGEGTVDKMALTEFFSQARRIYEADQKNLDQDEKNTHEETIKSIRNFYKEDAESEVTKHLQSVSRAFDQLRGMQIFTAGYLSSMSEFEEVTSVNKKVGQQSYQVWNGQDTDLFCPTGTIGIGTNSSHIEEAKEFIRVLLGQDVQKKDLQDGFPVNEDAFEAFTKNPTPDSSMVAGAEDKDGNSFMLDIAWPEARDIEQLKHIIQSLKTPSAAESDLKKEIIAIGAKALTGEKGVEDSVEEIIQKISLHLQE